MIGCTKPKNRSLLNIEHIERDYTSRKKGGEGSTKNRNPSQVDFKASRPAEVNGSWLVQYNVPVVKSSLVSYCSVGVAVFSSLLMLLKRSISLPSWCCLIAVVFLHLIGNSYQSEMSELDKILGRKYKLADSDNFEEFMKEIGVGLVTRKIAGAVSPVLDLSKEGDEYVITQKSTFKNMIIRFKPGVEFDQDTPDGRTVKSVITIEGNKLHEVQKDGSDTETVIDRVFTEDEVNMSMHHGSVAAKRVYKLVP